MRKIILLIFLGISFILVGMGIYINNDSNVRVDYGESNIYTKEDMDEAIEVIKKEFSSWNGCKLYSISYTSDENNNDETISWMNELGDNKVIYSQCIKFVSDFRSSVFGGDGFNVDSKYTNWQWYLARSEGGNWQLMTYGYG